MKVLVDIQETRQLLADVRASGRSVGFVPTMGAFHEGHLSLIRACVAECDFTVVSNYVNHLQFGPAEDFERYPRDLEADNRHCETEGADLVFAPSQEEMFPLPPLTSVCLEGLSETLEGEYRPGHLIGVGTIVTKLFTIVGECRAYFGEKDWQQLKLVTRMAQDLSLLVDVVGCAIVREADGLALSSRNRYLSDDERQRATSLSRALRHAVQLFQDGERNSVLLAEEMAGIIKPECDKFGYAVVADAETLEVFGGLENAGGSLTGGSLPEGRPPRSLRFLVAAHFGNARLIDNLGVDNV